MTITGKIIATCGHDLRSSASGNDIAVKDYDREGNKAICYMFVCDDCKVWYQRNNLILHNKESEIRWLKSKY